MREFVLSFTAIFVAVDVIGIVPLFLGLTRNMPEGERKSVLDKSLFVAVIVALVFATLGNSIFRFLSISVADFKIAGGLVLLLVSLADLLHGPEPQTQTSGSTGVVPLAVPLITGPGLITTAILQVSVSGMAITLAALLINFLIVWVALRKASVISRLIGRDGTVVVSKIVALLLAAIAVAMMRGGLEDTVRTFQNG